MSHYQRTIVFIIGLILAIASLLGAVAPALAQGGNVVVVNTGAINIRSGPSANTTSLGTVSGGVELAVTGRSADGAWWRVDTAFGTGWVSASLVAFQGVLDAVPVVDQPAGVVEPPTVIVDRFAATVYRNPNPDSFVVGIAPTNAVLVVSGRSMDGNWWQVETPMGTGWINAGEVAFRGDISLVQRVGDPGPSFNGPTIRVNVDTTVLTQPGGGETLATLPAGTALPASGRSADNTWWQVAGIFGIGWIPVSNVSLAGSAASIRVASDATVGGPEFTGRAFATALVEAERKVAYAGDSFSSDPMWDARLGEQLGVVGRSADGLWLQVTKPGYIGWMNFSGLTLQGDMAGIPIVTLTVTVNNVAIVNIHRLNIRGGPGAQYQSLTSVPGGTTLSVTGRHPTLPWLRVEGDFGVGWVRILYIVFRGNWSAVPFVTEPVGTLEAPVAYLGVAQYVYSQPNLDFPTGGLLPAGLYVIVGWTPGLGWAELETPLGNVWLPSDLFLMRGIAQNAPVVQ
jgi:uncharacterized protein YraI